MSAFITKHAELFEAYLTTNLSVGGDGEGVGINTEEVGVWVGVVGLDVTAVEVGRGEEGVGEGEGVVTVAVTVVERELLDEPCAKTALNTDNLGKTKIILLCYSFEVCDQRYKFVMMT